MPFKSIGQGQHAEINEKKASVMAERTDLSYYRKPTTLRFVKTYPVRFGGFL